MRTLLIISLLQIFSIGCVNAQTFYFDSLDQAKKIRRDSIRKTYIKEFHDRVYVKPIITGRIFELEFKDENKQVADITYKPSSSAYLGFGLYMFDLNFELSFKLPQNEEETPSRIFGETKSFDFQTNIYAKKWGADISFQRYNGMYLDKPEDHFSGRQPGDPYPIRNDLRLRYFQMNTFYVFNSSKFSFRSPYVQSEQQLKNAGSVITNIFVSNFQFNSDSTLIPESARPFFSGNEMLQRGRVTTLAILPGYTHTFTKEKFYANAALSIGPGHLWIRYNEGDQDKEDIRIRGVVNARLALGYNGDWFFGGITAVTQIVSARIENLQVNSNSGNIKFFVGARFLEKGFLKKDLF